MYAHDVCACHNAGNLQQTLLRHQQHLGRQDSKLGLSAPEWPALIMRSEPEPEPELGLVGLVLSSVPDGKSAFNVALTLRSFEWKLQMCLQSIYKREKAVSMFSCP